MNVDAEFTSEPRPPTEFQRLPNLPLGLRDRLPVSTLGGAEGRRGRPPSYRQESESRGLPSRQGLARQKTIQLSRAGSRPATARANLAFAERAKRYIET